MIGDSIRTIDDFDFRGKTALLRLDLNSPLDSKTQKILDDSRIREHARTVRELSDKDAKIAILAHQGDPSIPDQFAPLQQHGQILSKLTGREVQYIDDTYGPAAREAITKLEKGQVLMLENTRYFSEDTRLFEDTVKRSPEEQAKTLLVQKLYPLANVFVNDAFAAAHRAQPSLVGFPEVLPSVAGRVMEAELSALIKIRDKPQKPCIFCLGGRKISDKYDMMEPVLRNKVADKLLTSGVIGLLMLKASGLEVGSATESLIREMHYEKFLRISRNLLDTYGRDRIEFPIDVVIDQDGGREIDISSLPKDAPIMDVGKKTIEKYSAAIRQSKTVFFSGPPGAFENEQFSNGTKQILMAIAESGSFSVVGGGH